MKQKRVRLWIAALLAVLALALAGCDKENIEPNDPNEEMILDNYPYEPPTPAPAPHEGVFASEHGTMTFNGDGTTVQIDFDDYLAELTGLPAGEQDASYEFTTDDLPPHGYVDTRYDAADLIWLTVGENDPVMINVGKYEDGTFSSGVNCTTADRITFIFYGEEWVAVDFLKS